MSDHCFTDDWMEPDSCYVCGRSEDDHKPVTPLDSEPLTQDEVNEYAMRLLQGETQIGPVNCSRADVARIYLHAMDLGYPRPPQPPGALRDVSPRMESTVQSESEGD